MQQQQPQYIGEDHQVDTYFKVTKGRLKLREGNIENALIHYERENIADSKSSHVTLYQHAPHPSLKEVLTQALGILAVVDKKRRIYFIENVKFHFDSVKELGTFVEVEAIDTDGSIGIDKLQKQCNYYIRLFNLTANNFVGVSYSDLVMEKMNTLA